MSKQQKRKSILDHIVPAATDQPEPLATKLPPPPAAARIEFVPFNTRLSVANDLALHRAAYYVLGKTKQELVNEALTLLFETRYTAESKKPHPKENAQQ